MGKADTINIIIKVLSYEKEHGKYNSYEDIPQEYRDKLKELEMNPPELTSKIDSFKNYLKDFIPELSKTMGY